MDPTYAFDTIDAATFDSLLDEYPNVVPERLGDLEHQRLKTIPNAVQCRAPPSLTKAELAILMDWKLAHGTFRPSLKKLVQQNDDAFVRSQTEMAFGLAGDTDGAQIAEALTTLCKLRGVGPATASLLMSARDLERLPFFSDELYRWAFFDDANDGKGQGWERQLKYTAKEWIALHAAVDGFRLRLAKLRGNDRGAPAALEVEKVAYVLGKRTLGGDSPVKKTSDKKRKATVTKGTEPAYHEEAPLKEDGLVTSDSARATRSSKRKKSS